MSWHPVEEMQSFMRDAYRCNFFGKDRDALHALLALRPWAGRLLHRFYPAKAHSVCGVYEIEWPRKLHVTHHPTPRIIYFHMGHDHGRPLPVLLLAVRENATSIPLAIPRRMAALGRRARVCLTAQAIQGV